MTQIDPTRFTWRKSSRSNASANCVEVGADWRKSSRSNSNGHCVEVATTSAVVGVRDSKDREGAVLAFRDVAWVAFVAGVKGGEFDR